MFSEKEQGQTLVEALLAIFVITMALLGFLSRSSQNYIASNSANRKIVAINLAREGLEVVRNFRDSNWLRGCDDPEAGTPPDCYQWYTDIHDDQNIRSALIISFDKEDNVWSIDLLGNETMDKCIASEICYLYLDDGVYTERETDELTIYNRLIEVIGICNSETDDIIEYECLPSNDEAIGLKVKSLIRYKDNNNWKNVELEEWLYNWR